MHILIKQSINCSFHSGWPCLSYPGGSARWLLRRIQYHLSLCCFLPWAQPQRPALPSGSASFWLGTKPSPHFSPHWSPPAPGPCFCLGVALLLLPDTPLVSPGKSALLCCTLGAQKSLRQGDGQTTQNKENSHPPRPHLILQRWSLVLLPSIL